MKTKTKLPEGIYQRRGHGGRGVQLFQIVGSCRGDLEEPIGYGETLEEAIAACKQLGHWPGLFEACRMVENAARSLGKDCQIIFSSRVSVAPPSWPGDATGETLYEALMEAKKSQ